MGLVAVAVMVMTTFAPRVAHACSPPSGGCHETVDLFSEITDRPTNACILASWELTDSWDDPDAGMDAATHEPSPDAGTRDFVYVAPDGTEIALLPGALRCPEVLLEPLTEYRVVGPSDCGRGPPRDVGRFTTGAGPDTTPPTAPGAVHRYCHRESCGSSSCCGPYSVVITNSSWAPSSDDSRLVLYRGRGLQRQNTLATFQDSGDVMFGVIFTGGALAHRGSGVTSVVAVDIAGNESDPGPAGDWCPPEAFVPPDAGFDAGPSDGSRASSCAATRGCDTKLHVAALVVLALLIRRRR